MAHIPSWQRGPGQGCQNNKMRFRLSFLSKLDVGTPLTPLGLLTLCDR